MRPETQLANLLAKSQYDLASSMRRFLASAWFPFLICIVIAGVTVGAYAGLKPAGADVDNEEILKIARITGWAIGPAAGLLSLLLIGIMNVIRRVVRARRIGLLHPIVVLLGIAPWLALSWMLTDEPRFTPIARAAIDFVGRPLLWGSLGGLLATLLLSLPLLIPSKGSSKTA